MMDNRSREARRLSSVAAGNGLPRRRHRSGSLRDSTDDDDAVLPLHDAPPMLSWGAMPVRKKDRDRGRDRDRERDRERERERERDHRDRDRMSSRSKRRRGDRMMMVHGSNRDDGVDDSSEESVNDEEDDDDDDDAGVGVLPSASSMKMLPPNPSLSSSSLSNHHQHHRKSFPPPAKAFRTSPNTAPSPWKVPDEMIGVPVPRKARSASTKRSHDCWASSAGVGGGDQVVHRQASTSPVRSSGPGVLASASASPAPPVSPSSSNASVKKKLKPNGPKQKPPKLSSKSASSAQDDIEIEIAEVLYGLMRQPQGLTKQETAANDSTKFESREVINNNKSTGDAKSRVSSPISNSPCSVPHSSSVPPTNSSSSAAPMSAIAPKRKRPRPVKYEDENPSSIFQFRNGAISSTAKVDADHQQAKTEASSSPNLEKNSGSAAAENAAVSYDILAANRAAQPSSDTPQAEPAVKAENNNQLPDSKPLSGEPEARDFAVTKEEPPSPKESSSPAFRLEDNRVSSTAATKVNPTVSVNKREEKFQIDLMAPPPPPLRSSPERDSEVDFVAVDPKPMVTDVEMEMKPAVKENDKAVKAGKGDAANNNNNNNSLEPELKKAKVMAEEVESQKAVVNHKERNIDLQLDLEKPDRDITTNVASSGNKLHQQVNKQQQQQQQQPSTEKTAQSGPLPLPMSMAGWPGGLPHMGYMAPLQGVVSMDGSSVSSAAMQPLHLQFNHPRPKRCATHCYIARNILSYQQLTRMNPFWPAAAGSALQYGAKACNLNIVPPTDLHPAHPARSANPMQDKGQALAIFPGQAGKDRSTQPANLPDNAQRKQILLQQALPPGPPNNILPGPAFIFPLSQQQAAAAASVRPGTLKLPTVGGAGSSVASNSASITAAATPVAGATAMSFNYPNMPGNETPYLILQNGPYPIPIPAHVGASPAYRGTPPQGMPFFNGTFYSSQMVHSSQLQQQPPPTPQSQQNQQGHQNPSISSGSSSSHKHMQNQQPRPHNGSVNGGSGNLQGFPAIKNQQSQPLQLQQRQQSQNQNVPHQARQLESELGSEDSPSTADSRVTRSSMNIYGQNFALPMHPHNFALMTSVPGATTASGNPGEKKQQSKQQGTKAGVDSLPSPAFAMSFASINGATTAPGLDLSSIAQNHALLQGPPEATRQSYHQMMAAAQAAQKNYHGSEEGKAGGNDATNVEEERKAMGGTKASAPPGQSIAFSRPELADMSISTIPGNMVIESSARTLNLGSTSARTSGSAMSTAFSTTNSPVVQQQMQRSQQHQQQLIQLQKQQPFTAASARTKPPPTSNGNVFSDHISASASMAAKFSNALPAFPQNLVQSSGSNSPVQSPQWKNSVRTASSQIPSQPLAPTSSALKNLPQQQGRNQLGHTQISFAANNAKPSATLQGQPPTGTNQSPSPVVVGSPTTSSISKSTGGSPRNTSTSTSNKGGQSSTLSSQQAKNSPSGSTQKSSPIGGRNIPPIMGHPPNTNASSSSNTKSQLSQQQQQQQFPKHSLPQPHMLYATFVQAQAQHGVSSTNATSAASGFYLQRHRSEQQQPSQGSSGTSSAGMLSLCPTVSLSNTSTTDPAKAVAAAAVAAVAAGNMKGGGLPPQSLIHAQFAAAQSSGKPHQLLPAGFTYVQAVPTVQLKPAEQKQPAGE